MYADPEPCDIGGAVQQAAVLVGESMSARCAKVIAVRLRCESMAPLERPVVPLV